MKLLDLFCGAGGASMGYSRAGFDVTGMDIKPQPNYPFAFRQADVLEMMRHNALDLSAFDVVHASPPCQLWSKATQTQNRGTHVDGVIPTREYLSRWGGPYVIENVPPAPLVAPLMLCGSEFGLSITDENGKRWHLRRHRLFESNISMMGGGGCYCRLYKGSILTVAGSGLNGHRSKTGPGQTRASASQSRELMGIDWASKAEVVQAIPPVYTQHLGWQLIAYLTEVRSHV